MSVNIVLPSVKYVCVSYYLVVTSCRSVSVGRSRVLNNYLRNYSKATGFNTSVRNFSCRQRSQEPPWKILFFGTDHFSLACLQPLFAKLNTGTLISGLGIVSSPESTIHKFANLEKLPIHTWPPDNNVLKNYDMGIVVSFGKLIPEDIINALPLGILNIHGSLLPRWRGAAPIAYAIMNGDSETGISIMLIKPHKFDIGDIVRQYRCSIAPHEKTPELTERLANHAGHLLMECIRDMPKCLRMATPQPADGVTYAPKLNSKLSSVNWGNMSAERVYNLYRAISYKYPLTTTWFGKPIRLSQIKPDYETMAEKKQDQNQSSSHKSALNFLNSSDKVFKQDKKLDFKENVNASPGKIQYNRSNQIVKIQCADGKWVICENFKVANGPSMPSSDFYNGFLSKRNIEDWFFR